MTHAIFHLVTLSPLHLVTLSSEPCHPITLPSAMMNSMVQLCPRCQRANPRQAVFCHFDGCLLRQGAGASVGQMLQEFVFPSGRRCRTYDELASGCYYEWEDARTMLQEG